MTRWGIVTTIRAPLPEIQAFLAHHLSLGADQITLHLDDPDPQMAAALGGIDRVQVVECTRDYWQSLCGARPPNQEERQAQNMQRVYDATGLDWLAHIDGDEFLKPARPVAEVLSDLPKSRILARVQPWEALFTPGLPDDIFTARWFRRPVQAARRPLLHAELFAPYSAALPEGVLSHAAGKCFYRRGVAGLSMRLHGARLNGERVNGGPFLRDIQLLHFHAQDPVRWKAALPQRLATGAYRFRPAMVRMLQSATPEDVDRFYAQVMQPSLAFLRDLSQKKVVLKADLGLRDKIAVMRAGASAMRGP